MKKINVTKKELEEFLDSLKSNFLKAKSVNISYQEFKNIFCNTDLDFSTCGNNEEYKKIYDSISSSDTVFFKRLREYIINNFVKEYSYCPYCWKTPLIHFDESNKTKRMFQFDHFFPKDAFHKWIINFYNLIPSCNACNHLKSDNLPSWKVFHPYFGWIKRNGMTVDILWDNFDDISYCDKDIKWRDCIFKTEHSKYFKLGKIYDKSNRDTSNVYDFIFDKRLKIKDELKRLPNRFWWNQDKAKDYFFEYYYSKDKDEMMHHQNGKLKKDLIENMKL